MEQEAEAPNSRQQQDTFSGSDFPLHLVCPSEKQL